MKTMRYFPSFIIVFLLSFFFTYPAGATESSNLKIHVTDPKLPNVAIVTTGGTIAEKLKKFFK